jgi:hypothetical protein
MVLAMKASGKITEPMDKENSSMSMEMSMKVTGLMIRLMALVFISMSTVLDMKESGKTISSMVKEKKRGQMALYTKANISRAKNTVSECTAGMTVPGTKVNGMRIKSEDLAYTHG